MYHDRISYSSLPSPTELDIDHDHECAVNSKVRSLVGSESYVIVEDISSEDESCVVKADETRLEPGESNSSLLHLFIPSCFMITYCLNTHISSPRNEFPIQLKRT